MPCFALLQPPSCRAATPNTLLVASANTCHYKYFLYYHLNTLITSISCTTTGSLPIWKYELIIANKYLLKPTVASMPTVTQSFLKLFAYIAHAITFLFQFAFLTELLLMLAHYRSERPEWWSPLLCITGISQLVPWQYSKLYKCFWVFRF